MYVSFFSYIRIKACRDDRPCSLPIAVWESRLSSAGFWLCYIPMHDVAPRAVTIAVATDAMICTINLSVSLLVMVLIFKFYHFYNFYIVQRVGA